MIKGIVGGFIYVTVSLFSSMLRLIAIFERDLLSRTMSFTFNCVDVFSRVCVFSPFHVFGCIIHEGGHAVSAYLLYKNCTVQVTATTFTTWQTTIIKTGGIAGLSKLGSYLGEHCSKMVFIAMGPLVQVATCQIVLIGALILKSSYPELSKNLFLYSLDTISSCGVVCAERIRSGKSFSTQRFCIPLESRRNPSLCSNHWLGCDAFDLHIRILDGPTSKLRFLLRIFLERKRGFLKYFFLHASINFLKRLMKKFGK